MWHSAQTPQATRAQAARPSTKKKPAHRMVWLFYVVLLLSALAAVAALLGTRGLRLWRVQTGALAARLGAEPGPAGATSTLPNWVACRRRCSATCASRSRRASPW